MPHAFRHQCFVYEGTPSQSLPGLAASIRQHLDEQYRCLYLHSPAMVDEMRSLLLAGGTDVTQLIMQGQLVLSSGRDHLLNGRFDINRMLSMLENGVKALDTAIRELCKMPDALMLRALPPDYLR